MLVPVKSLRDTDPYRSSVTQDHKAYSYAAPISGLDLVHPLTQMDPLTTIVMENAICRAYGVAFRPGWKSWSSLIPGEVRTVMPYNAARGLSSTNSRLFAACSDGKIYDVTDQTDEVTVPPVAVTIPNQDIPGEFSWVSFSETGTNYLVIAGAGGGVWTYDDVGGWVDRTLLITLTPVAPTIPPTFDFVTAWKGRLWFIRNNTCEAYYLEVGAIQGAAALFDFGPLFQHGGDLQAMASWTLEDGGHGVDDKLVVVSSEGDVIIYQGQDPNDPLDFQLAGRWYVGRVPYGRRFMDRYGGDLGILCQYGFLWLSRLIQQKGVAIDPQALASYRINPKMAVAIRDTVDLPYWEVRYFAALQAMLVNAPVFPGGREEQFVMNVDTNAWSTFVGIPMLTCEVFRNNFYFGTDDGRVGQAFAPEVQSDGVATDGTPGKTIEVNCQSAFVAPGDPVRIKRMTMFNMLFQAESRPNVKAQINVDWNLGGTPGSPGFQQVNTPLWDTAKWNQARWSGGSQNTFRGWVGADVVGYYASLRFTANGIPGTLFTNWTCVAMEGGLM